MKLARLAGLIFAAILAMNLVAVAVASAADPEFLDSIKQTFKILSGTTKLAGTEQSVTCSKDEGSGKVLGAATVSNVTVLFTGCVAKEGEKEACTAKTDGGISGDIITNTLDGELGLVTKTEAASGVGLLLLPEAGKVFVKISAVCTSPELFAVEGSLAGQADNIGVLSRTGLLLFGGSPGVQSIKEIGILGTTVKPKLSSFGVAPVSEIGTETIDYSGLIEIM
jgi:hypothetical protein